MNAPKRKYVVKKTMVGSGNSRHFHNWKQWKEGDYIIGKYVANIEDKFKHECPILEVLEAHLSNSVVDKDKNPIDIVGKRLQLNYCGSLRYAFYDSNPKQDKQPIEKGSIVEVRYLGKKELEGGEYEGSESHSLEIQVLEETEEVAEEESSDWDA